MKKATTAATPTLPYTLAAVKPTAIGINPNTNPRIINEKHPDFRALMNSIKAVGVQQPICVRRTEKGGKGGWELLAGERRLRATLLAARPIVPVLDYGHIDDDVAFEVTFNENFRRKDLNPLESGRAVSMLMTRYRDDVAAVASKLGETPHWVMQHAHVDRALSSDWQKAAETNERFEGWTTGHWIEIAKLPSPLQEKALKWALGPNGYSLTHWGIDRLKEHLTPDRLPLLTAPFDTTECQTCPYRTGHQPLLFADAAETVSGDKDACLHKACYDKKAIRAEKQVFRETEANAIFPGLVPLDVSDADQYGNPKGWEAKVHVKKVHGKKLLRDPNVEFIKLAKKPTTTEEVNHLAGKGIVPALIVCGQGKGSVKWIQKPCKEDMEVREAPGAKQTRENAKQDAKRARWRKVVHQVATDLAALSYEDVGSVRAMAFSLLMGTAYQPSRDGDAKARRTILEAGMPVIPPTPDAIALSVEAIGRVVWEAARKELKHDAKTTWVSQYEFNKFAMAGPLFGMDLKAMHGAVMAEERKAKKQKKAKAPAKTKTPAKKATAKGG